MKKILTAIGNPTLNEKLKNENFIEIKYKDIQYKEAILEILGENKNFDIIIINEILPGEINLIELLKKIKVINEKIKIIIILEKENNYLENELKKINIFDIYLNNKININKLINIIKEEEINNEEELKKEIKKLKKIIEENNIKKNNENKNNKKNSIMSIQKNSKNNLKNYSTKKDFLKQKISKILKSKSKNKFNQIIRKENIEEKSIHKANNTISILGSDGVGKSIVCLTFAQKFINQKRDVLIFIFDSEDFLFYNNFQYDKIKNKDENEKTDKGKSIKIYKRKKVKNFQNKAKKSKIKLNKIKDKKYKIKINYKIIKNKIKKIKLKNFNIINCSDLIKNKNYFLNNKYLKKIIKYYKKNYNIIFDIKNNLDEKIKKIIIKNSEINYLIFEPNLIGIKKANIILNNYIKNFKIDKNNINLIINKYNINSINIDILQNIFKNIKLKINRNNYFEKLINNNFKFNRIEYFLKTKLLIKNYKLK